MGQSLSLNFNHSVVEYMHTYKLTINDLMVIMCLYESKMELLIDFLSNKTTDQRSVMLNVLVERGYVVNDPRGSTNYGLSPTGAKTALELSSLMAMARQPVLMKDKEDIDELVKKYLELFPVGTKGGGGKTLRSHPRDVHKKLVKFRIDYKYDDETILKATQQFLDGFKLKRDYSFCPTAMYFILKDGTSQLAAECEKIKVAGVRIVNPFDEDM